MQNAPYPENNQQQATPQGTQNSVPPQNQQPQGANFGNNQVNEWASLPQQNINYTNGYQPPVYQNYGQNQPFTPPPFAYYPPPQYDYQGQLQGGYQNPYPPQPPVMPPQGGNLPPQQPYYPPPQQNYYNPNQPYYIPYAQPIYSPQPVPQPKVLTEEDIKKSHEKKAVKKTAHRIGFGLLLFYMVSVAIGIIISPLYDLKSTKDLVNNPAFSLILNMVITLIGFLLGAFFIFKTEKVRPDRLLSYGRPQKGKLLPAIMTGLGCCYVANIVTALLQNSLNNFFPVAESSVELPQGIWGFVLSIMSVAVFPAILEEFLFRGAIMGSLLKFGKPFAIFVSAAIFGLIHGNIVQIPFAFMVGLVIGFLVIETDSIWTGVIIHFFNNALSVCLDYIMVYQGDEVSTAVQMILMATIIVIGFFGIYILSIKNKNLFKYNKVPHVSTSKQKLGWVASTATIIIFMVIIGLEIGLVQFPLEYF